MNKKIPLTLLCFLLLALPACTTAGSARAAEKKALLEKKKAQFAALVAAATSNRLKPGTSKAQIEETYGTPADVFQSSSGVSTTEILTYEPVERSSRPVRLFLESGKLVTWSY